MAQCVGHRVPVLAAGGEFRIRPVRTVAALGDWRWQVEARRVNVVHVSSFKRNGQISKTKAGYGDASRAITDIRRAKLADAVGR